MFDINEIDNNTMFNIDEIYTVSNFLSLCNKTIENNIPTCWLQAELSNLTRPASGHWYFSLKDKNTQVCCALFRLNQYRIKFNPENGMQVLVKAAATLYATRGDFQLVIQHIEPVGVGNLNLAFEQLKTKLAAEGLFDNNHKQPLPQIVNTIGVISSATGAVIQDIIKVLNKRYPFAKILLFDCITQGQHAAKKLTLALNAADKSKQCDVLIIARGGGSLEDLWAFNEEVLARAIFNTKTPIISAIGHETDTTIADFVADLRAPTPSAAAVLATTDRLELLTTVKKLHLQLIQYYQQSLQYKQSQLNQLKLKLPNPSRQLNFLSQKLDYLNTNLTTYTKTNITSKQNKLRALYALLKQHSPITTIKHAKALKLLFLNQLNQQIKQTIDNCHFVLKNANAQLIKNMLLTLDKNKSKLSIQATSLHYLSPLNTLSRGFSITTDTDNKILFSTHKAKLNQTITTCLTDGKIFSEIKKIKKN